MPSTTWSPTRPEPAADGPSLVDLLDRLAPERRRQVLTHPSWATHPSRSYERLEFLGDGVLRLAAAHELFRRHPAADEGELTLMCQRVVSGEACAEVARDLGLPGRLVAAAPPPRRGSAARLAEQASVQAAVLEALIAAAWLDSGPGEAEAAVVAAFAVPLDRAPHQMRDPKTALQEEAARRRRGPVAYVVVATEGPDHDRVFTSEVRVAGEAFGTGTGPSKQASEQAAAAEALVRLGGPVAGGAPC